MNFFTIIFIILFLLYILCVIIRKLVSKYINNINKPAKFNINTNYLYDDYYENMETNNGKDLVGNLGIIRYNFMDEVYKSEVDILKLEKDKDYNILNISLTNCNFDIYLSNRYEKIVIHSLINNLTDFNRCKEKIQSLNLNNKIKIYYGKYSDISNVFKDKKFDRIVLLESLGKLKNRPEFVKQLKDLLHIENSFIYIKTLVFKDFILDNNLNKNMQNELYEKQKYVINFWNYNFSTNQAIINDFNKNGFQNIKMKSMSALLLFFTYNMEDILNLLKLYFIDLEMSVNDLDKWYVLFTLNISHFIIE